MRNPSASTYVPEGRLCSAATALCISHDYKVSGKALVARPQ